MPKDTLLDSIDACVRRHCLGLDHEPDIAELTPLIAQEIADYYWPLIDTLVWALEDSCLLVDRFAEGQLHIDAEGLKSRDEAAAMIAEFDMAGRTGIDGTEQRRLTQALAIELGLVKRVEHDGAQLHVMGLPALVWAGMP